MEFRYKKYDNFNAISFIVNKQFYIYESYSNNFYRVDQIVSDIIDDSFCLEDDQLFNKYCKEYSISELKKSIQSICDYKKQGFFSTYKIQEFSVSKNYNTEEKVNNRISEHLATLILNVTENCNLRCKYCIYSGKYVGKRVHNSNNEMSWDIAKKAINRFLDIKNKHELKNINFYGGETLLKFDLIKKVICYANKLDSKISYSINTNGTLLNDEMINFFQKYNVRLLISLDGPKDIHDQNRVFANGSGTYDKIIENLEIIKNKFPDYYKDKINFNLVFAPNQKDFKYFNEFFNVNKFTFLTDESKLKFALVNQDNNSYVHDTNYGIFLDKTLSEAYASYIDAKISGNHGTIIENKFLESSMKKIHYRSHRKLSEFDFHWPNGICIPGMRSVFVTADGLYYPCEKIYDQHSMQIGDVYNGLDIIAITKFIDMYRMLILHKCQNCFAYRFCGECFLGVVNENEFDLDRRNIQCHKIRNTVAKTMITYLHIRSINDKAFDLLQEDELAGFHLQWISEN